MIAFCHSARIRLSLDTSISQSSIKRRSIDTAVTAASERSRYSMSRSMNMDAETYRRADQAAHDVAQTHLREFVGEVTLVPGNGDADA